MYYVGIDLGGTTIKGGLVDENGVIVERLTRPTLAERKGSEIIEDIVKLGLELISNHGISTSEVDSIGVGAPGLIDSKNKIVVTSSNINFDNDNFEVEAKKYTDLPIYLENDANCATVAEFVYGSMKGHNNAIMFTIGTGVGGGVIVDGKLLKGTHLGETELGHMIVDYTGHDEPCNCGQVGCLESFASANSIVKYAKELSKENPNTKILEFSENLDNIDAKSVFDAYDLGDETAVKVINRFNTYLAIGIVNVVNIFKPSIVSIGGGASARGEKLTNPIEEIAQNMIYGDGFKNKIVTATLGNDAGIIGAGMLSKVN